MITNTIIHPHHTMHKRVIQLGGLAAAALAASSASAEVKLNENFSVGGYAAGSYRSLDESDTDRFDLDAAKIAFNTTFNPVSATASVYHSGGSTPGDDLTLLDAYVNYDAGNGVTITGGKFLTYLGYEAFDIPNLSQISYANGDFLAPIPGYHSGVKVGYSDKAYSAGLALVDSVYGDTALKGDGELKNNAGVEGFVSYTGVEGLTLWGGFAYQGEGEKNAASKPLQEVFVWDIWAQYAVTKELTIAGEFVMQDSSGLDGSNWLAYANYAFSDKISTTFRVSGEEVDDGASFTKYTISPALKLTDNLLVRGEVSRYDYKDYSLDTDTFYGVQAVFKF